ERDAGGVAQLHRFHDLGGGFGEHDGAWAGAEDRQAVRLERDQAAWGGEQARRRIQSRQGGQQVETIVVGRRSVQGSTILEKGTTYACSITSRPTRQARAMLWKNT